MENIYFTSFVCERCKTEIEASSDMIGQETECPACGAKIVIPDDRSAARTCANVALKHIVKDKTNEQNINSD